MSTYYIQIGDEMRPMTEQETADLEALSAEIATQQATKKATQESAINKLKALGLTDEEIAALAG